MSVVKYRDSASDPWQIIQVIKGRDGLDGQDCSTQIYIVSEAPSSTDPEGLYFVVSPVEAEE